MTLAVNADGPVDGPVDGPADAQVDAQVLAARWQIERLRRPAVPGVVWLGFAKPEIATFECLACGDAAFKQGVLRAEGRTLYLCSGCASHQFDPPPPREPPDAFADRYAAEYAADYAAAAEAAARATAGRPGGVLLDLGSGPGLTRGLTLDLVRGMQGWTDTGAAADVVLCEGVLDRSGDPLAVLGGLPARSADGARWLIAVADAARVYASDDPGEIGSLVAPPRTLLASRFGLQSLLARAGLPDLGVREADGTLRADRDPAPTTTGMAAEVLDRYLARRQRAGTRSDGLAVGIAALALERAVDRADWPAAKQVAARLAPSIAAAAEAARGRGEQDSLPALFRAAPLCGPALLYHAGMLTLHADGPSTQALLCFELAAGLAQRAYVLAPSLMGPERQRRWAAEFHAALVRARLGETSAARRAFEGIADAADPLASAWAIRARAEIAALSAPAPAPAANGPRRTARRAMR